MTREEMIKIIIKMYNETVEALEYADKEYNNDKKNFVFLGTIWSNH